MPDHEPPYDPIPLDTPPGRPGWGVRQYGPGTHHYAMEHDVEYALGIALADKLLKAQQRLMTMDFSSVREWYQEFVLWTYGLIPVFQQIKNTIQMLPQMLGEKTINIFVPRAHAWMDANWPFKTGNYREYMKYVGMVWAYNSEEVIVQWDNSAIYYARWVETKRPIMALSAVVFQQFLNAAVEQAGADV